MAWWQALFLGLLQGLTEFLPVSSSGHLVLVEKWMGLPDDPALTAFDLFVHLATVAAIVVGFRRELISLATERRDWIWKLIAASVPAGLFYVVMKKGFELDVQDLRELWMVGIAYLAAGAFIAIGDRLRRGKDRGTNEAVTMSWRAAIWTGVSQAVTLLPGVSRSGTTITAGRLAGARADTAMSFSFLLGMIAILGGNVLKADDISRVFAGGTPVPPAAMATGFAAAFAAGLLAIWILKRLLSKGIFFYFGIYCMALGMVLLIVHVTGT